MFLLFIQNISNLKNNTLTLNYVKKPYLTIACSVPAWGYEGMFLIFLADTILWIAVVIGCVVMVPSEFAKATFLNRAAIANTARNRNHCNHSLVGKFLLEIYMYLLSCYICFLEVVRLFHLCLTCEIFLQLCQMGDTLAKLLEKKKQQQCIRNTQKC